MYNLLKFMSIWAYRNTAWLNSKQQYLSPIVGGEKPLNMQHWNVLSYLEPNRDPNSILDSSVQ